MGFASHSHRSALGSRPALSHSACSANVEPAERLEVHCIAATKADGLRIAQLVVAFLNSDAADRWIMIRCEPPGFIEPLQFASRRLFW
jgi:hypothetical protein